MLWLISGDAPSDLLIEPAPMFSGSITDCTSTVAPSECGMATVTPNIPLLL
jgi:hypothetical protein